MPHCYGSGLFDPTAWVKQRAVGQGTDRTVSRRGALGGWHRWETVLSSRILAL